jgi:hypothetical protein
MTTKEVLEIVKARGLKIVLNGDRPEIDPQGKKGVITDKLLSVLKIHRERIIEILKRECGKV